MKLLARALNRAMPTPSRDGFDNNIVHEERGIKPQNKLLARI